MNTSSNLEIIGRESSFQELPALVSLGRRSYFLVQNKSGYQLLSTVCPHMGGQVSNIADCFKCPIHGWTFNHDSGAGINTPTAGLASYPVTVRDGTLWADLPPPTVSVSPEITRASPAGQQLSILFHAHACLEINYKGFSLLTDPWLSGPAFLGSWIQYPPPVVDVSSLRPDAIWITHEHSDHFHEPTLAKLDRSIPVYVPDFPNRRMVNRLAKLGFADVRPIEFGQTYDLADGIKLTCFEPGGLWNDSIGLLDINGFRLLNLNDTGLNQRIAPLVSPVDAIAFQFSASASGYPVVWDHLEHSEKLEIIEGRHEGMIEMCRQALRLYGGKYLIPFAADFALWHPDHRKYQAMLKSGARAEAKRMIDGNGVQVIDLLPGDSWDAFSGKIHRNSSGGYPLKDGLDLLNHLEDIFDADLFKQHHPSPDQPSRSDVEKYFLRMNSIPEMAFCEDMIIRVRTLKVENRPTSLDLSFEVSGGVIRIMDGTPANPDLQIVMPPGVLKEIITEDLSWDEAHIGFWCNFSRPTDVYNAGFWRLLQAPYYGKTADPPAIDGTFVSGNTVIADLIETHGKKADRILRRYGLYCMGCDHSTACSIALGARDHGVAPSRVDYLVKELVQVLGADEI